MTNVLCVQVHPGAGRPYYLKFLGPERGVFIRVGSTNRSTDECMRGELRRAVRNESFDEMAMSSNLNSEAIDFRAASECFRPLRHFRQTDLETLQMLVNVKGALRPTVGGVSALTAKRTFQMLGFRRDASPARIGKIS